VPLDVAGEIVSPFVIDPLQQISGQDSKRGPAMIFPVTDRLQEKMGQDSSRDVTVVFELFITQPITHRSIL
jgi:hypothetical protein